MSCPTRHVRASIGITTETVTRLFMAFDKAELVRILPYTKRVKLLDLPKLCELADGRPCAMNFGFDTKYGYGQRPRGFSPGF